MIIGCVGLLAGIVAMVTYYSAHVFQIIIIIIIFSSLEVFYFRTM